VTEEKRTARQVAKLKAALEAEIARQDQIEKEKGK